MVKQLLSDPQRSHRAQCRQNRSENIHTEQRAQINDKNAHLQRLRIQIMTEKQRSDQRDRNAHSQGSQIQIMTAQLRDLNRERNTQQQRIQRAKGGKLTREIAIVRDFSESEIRSVFLSKFRCDLHPLTCKAFIRRTTKGQILYTVLFQR